MKKFFDYVDMEEDYLKILYVTTIGNTMCFFKSFINQLIREGHVVDIAANEHDGQTPVDDYYRELGCQIYHISCERTPLSFTTCKAVKEINTVLKENDYDIVHCHTPVASMCTRLAAKGLRKKGLKVIYTAHGFHFYKGAPKKNWMIYYPVEMFCSRWTDVLITINQEDYALAKRKMKAKHVEYVPGVGIDTDKFANLIVDRGKKRRTIDVPEDAILILSVGELNENKNHQVVIRTLAQMNDKNIFYAIAGNGHLNRYLQDLVSELGMTEQIRLLGYRSDVAELYKAADIYVLPSLREGLNISVMEAMASGLPVVCGCIRGNVDLVDSRGGELFEPSSVDELESAIKYVLNRDAQSMSKHNYVVSKKYDYKTVLPRMTEIYRDILC